MTCGHCWTGNHQACNGLLRTSYGFCRCADQGHTDGFVERVLVPYRLPDGRIVQVDDSAAKGAMVIGFELSRGHIVEAVRVSASVPGVAAGGTR